MSFHLGKPILVMLTIATVTGVVCALRPAQRHADLNFWIFADSHYQAYKPLLPEFERDNHLTVNTNLLNFQGLLVRLSSTFMSDPKSQTLPDLAEIEIGWVGTFFRPPVKDIGFLPLNDLLKKSGWYDKILEQRFAPYSKDGVIFGIPHDVHPCVITYRDDLFREAGVDLPAAKTWPKYHEACERFERYWRDRGFRYRHAIELPEAAADYIIVMLLQRGINIVDDHNVVHINEPKVAQTMAFYAQLVAGPRKIAGMSITVSSGGTGSFQKDVLDGNLCSFITADWRAGFIKRWEPDLAGKMRMMPMPIFDPTDAPTSTWGGTMIGITKACRNPDNAWKLVEKLYFSKEGLESRRTQTDILPPVKTMWDNPEYHQPDPYYGGQKTNELFIALARQLPRRYVTPATALATAELGAVLTRAVDYMKTSGTDGLEAHCQQWLDSSAQDLNARIKQWSFDE